MADTTDGANFSSSAQAVLQHITKVKLETQERIYELQQEVKRLTAENTAKAEKLAELDSHLQAKKVGRYGRRCGVAGICICI